MPDDKKQIDELLRRHKKLKEERRLWEAHWQELAEIMLPRRADFTGAIQAGEKRTNKIYDSAPMLARRGLAAAIDGLLKPKTSRWFHIEPEAVGWDEDEAAKAWLEQAEERLRQAIYNPKAKFIERTGEVDDDLVTFGTGCIYIGEDRSRRRLLFRSVHLKDVFPAENADGDIDGVYVTLTLTARQAAERYGEDGIGAKTKEALVGRNPEPDRKFPFLWAVTPRREPAPARPRGRNLAFASVVVDVESEHTASAGSYDEFPFAIPRWDTASGELFGRSPAMLALPDAKTLQEVGKTLLIAGQKAVDPPLAALSDSVIGTPRTYPGGITYFDAEGAESLGGRFPIQPMETGANLPLGREMQNDLRDQIWAAFFRNVLQLPVAAPKMTATEVLERKEEFVRTIGPVFGRLEGDYIAPIVERSFNIMMRAGAFPPLPDSLADRRLKFEYRSPVEQARKQIEAAGAARAVELLAPFVAADASLMDNFDGDAIARDVPDVFGTPRAWLRSADRVAAIREARAEAAAAARSAELVERIADGLPKLAKALAPADGSQRPRAEGGGR